MFYGLFRFYFFLYGSVIDEPLSVVILNILFFAVIFVFGVVVDTCFIEFYLISYIKLRFLFLQTNGQRTGSVSALNA